MVTSATRPVPLTYHWALTPLHETLEELLTTHQAPVYVVHFTQAAALERAQALTSINVCTREEKDRIAELIGGFRFSPGFGKTLSRLVKHGIGVHHAGMLPKYRRLVEQLAQAGLLKVICGTDTLGVGINVPIRTVVFTGLTKYDGRRQRMLKAREFHQIAGRAGRAGFDTAGHRRRAGARPRRGEPPAGAQGRRRPEEAQARAAQEGARGAGDLDRGHLRPAGRGRARGAGLPDAGHPRDAAQRDRPARATRSRRCGGCCATTTRTAARRCGWCAGRSRSTAALLAAGVVERVDPPDEDGRTVRLVEGLQLGFALNQPLSTYALGVFDVLDPEAPTYALDVVSVVEATLEDPRPVLGAQEHKARGEAIGEMKADGIEYDERMELLEEVSWPKPLQELLEHTYEVYRRSHPWVAEDALSPKSVVRDMYERAMTFAEYVAFYGLTRSEGLVLRYLGDAYRALRQTVPERRPHRRARGHHRVARRRRPADRLEPARRVGAAQRPHPRGGGGRRGAAADPGEHHRQRAGVHGAGPQRAVPPGRAGRAAALAAARRPRRRGELSDERRGLARGAGGVLRGARLDRHRSGRPRAADAGGGDGSGAPGRCSRSSATRRATTTGGSRPRSTWTPPTTRGSWSWRSPASCSSDRADAMICLRAATTDHSEVLMTDARASGAGHGGDRPGGSPRGRPARGRGRAGPCPRHRTESAATLPAGVEVVTGDLTVPESLDAGAARCRVPCSSCGPPRRRRPGRGGAARGPRAAGRLPLVTAPDPAPLLPAAEPDGGAARRHRAAHRGHRARVDDHPAGDVRVERDDLVGGRDPHRRVVRWPYGAAETAPVDERDVAAVAARALYQDGHAGGDYVLTGPESLSQAEQVQHHR